MTSRMSFTMAAPGAGRPPAPKPEAPLAPVVKTVFMERRFRGGGTRRECWGAETKPDKAWAFERQEVPGTPWAVIHAETGTWVADFMGSLAECRRYVGSGAAQEDLDRLQAHERGEHEHERDGECERCLAEEDDER